MKHYPHHLDLQPAPHASGSVRLPGSKSISNRTLLLAALAEGTTEIHDLLASDDTHVMLMALQKLGIQWQQDGESSHYTVHGSGGTLPVHQADLFMGNAGTAIRPLTAALAVIGGDYTLHGVSRMHERPIGDLVDALNAIGANVEYTGQPGYPPLHIRRGHFHANRMQVKGNVSSQFLTALLMAAPLMAKQGAVTIDVVGELISKPYIEITLNLMRRFGVNVERDGWQSFTIAAGQKYRSPGSIHVEGDASSASYFLAAGAIGGAVRVEGVGQGSIQGDVRFVEALEQMGATITMGDNWIEAKSNGVLNAIDADFNHIPDAAMTIAVAALYADGTSTLRNIGSWRVKETDRLTAMAVELRKLGAVVEEGADYLRVTPPAQIGTAAIDTYDDHRMAMCFSLATLNGAARKGNVIRINDPKCVAKTFPDYFDAFAQIAHKDLL
jgi:3-phosphoshikimate 1-carboxyvinyltransferase